MTAKIKLNSASGGGSVSLQAPSSSSNNRVITLPDIADGTLLTSSSSVGITEIDTWYVTSGFNGTVDPIQNNLARFTSGGGYLGSGMSVSSGIWTFPATGFWLIIFEARSARVDAGRQSRYNYIKIASTTDNDFSSTDNTIGFSETGFYDNYSADYRYNGATATAIFDCTNTSTHKIKFETDVQDNDGNGVAWGQVYFKFIKLGDT